MIYQLLAAAGNLAASLPIPTASFSVGTITGSAASASYAVPIPTITTSSGSTPSSYSWSVSWYGDPGFTPSFTLIGTTTATPTITVTNVPSSVTFDFDLTCSVVVDGYSMNVLYGGKGWVDVSYTNTSP